MKLISIIVLLFVCSVNVQAFDAFSKMSGDPKLQNCYGFAMVGMDSVINSRLGVPPEDVLHLAKYIKVSEDKIYSTRILNNILNAYLWDDSPHSYAISVFYKCAQANKIIRSASSE
ncbi:hypothetical protein MNBD_GAMMA16-158 [hydrothermal vent metagenome]|uniref:Rap1a immunity protein domain-containing protein n=1 Tax=hydrothermal vent metagenome TaxID=652676 RepID=A0A3B0ZDE2_9ZZZZ